MSTRYYFEFDNCPHCGHRPDRLLIGQSSYGWCFMLQIYPTLGINNLEDWIEYWEKTPGVVRNEYGNMFSTKDILEVITERSALIKPKSEQWYKDNHAQEGPKGLARSIIDGNHCVGHGKGTYDYYMRLE